MSAHVYMSAHVSDMSHTSADMLWTSLYISQPCSWICSRHVPIMFETYQHMLQTCPSIFWTCTNMSRHVPHRFLHFLYISWSRYCPQMSRHVPPIFQTCSGYDMTCFVLVLRCFRHIPRRCFRHIPHM